jgi:winged helix-turn-helix DNA-binding protein
MTCSVCDAPPEIRQSLELLAREQRMTYKELSRRSGFSKSAIFRHLKFHVSAAVLKRAREAKLSAKHVRLITKSLDGNLTVQKTCERISEADLLPNDVIISVQLTQAVAGNPLALGDPSVTLEELETRFTARGKRAAKAQDETQPDPPLPLPIAAKAVLQSPKEALPAQSDEPVEPQCEHLFRNPSAGIERCEKCGWQEPVPKLLSVGFDFIEEKRSRSPYGRF